MSAPKAPDAVTPVHRPFRRHVFYIPGYDPIHPRRYRELYRKEGALQAKISGYTVALTPKPRADRYGWRVTSLMEAEAEAEFDVLVWSDIVRTSMDGTFLSTYLHLFRTAAVYIGTGALFRLMRLRKGPIIAALYPIFFLLAQLGLATLCGFGLWKAVQFLGSGLFVDLMAAGAGFALGWAVLQWFRVRDNRFFAYYLMHDYAYSARFGGANPPELEARMRAFRQEIEAALQGTADEVLVVGHSSGAHLAVSILADLLRDAPLQTGPKLAFLSLGQVVPMVSFLPKARRLRADLQFLSEQSALTWVDVTAPGDGCAFALCDPVAVSGVAREAKIWPLVLSAAFTQTLSPARWKALRWRFFRLHFQYLCAFDRPGDYDYFRITAGPVSLRDRYEGRKPSASRIEHSVSGYRDIAS
jgi:hypothetical protein